MHLTNYQKWMTHLGKRTRLAVRTMNLQKFDIPKNDRKTYQILVDRLLSVERKVMVESWNLHGGWINTPRNLDNAFNEYATMLSMLEMTNDKWGKYLEAQGYAMGTLLSIISINFYKHLHRVSTRLSQDLSIHKKELKILHREYTETKIQTAAHILLNIITTILIPVGSIQKLLTIMTVTTVESLTVDAVYGPNKFNAFKFSGLQSMNDALGAAIGAYDKLKSITRSYGTVVSTLVTFWFDLQEVKKASGNLLRQIVILKNLHEQLNSTLNYMTRLRPHLIKYKVDLVNWSKAYEVAIYEMYEFERNMKIIKTKSKSHQP